MNEWKGRIDDMPIAVKRFSAIEMEEGRFCVAADFESGGSLVVADCLPSLDAAAEEAARLIERGREHPTVWIQPDDNGPAVRFIPGCGWELRLPEMPPDAAAAMRGDSFSHVGWL